MLGGRRVVRRSRAICARSALGNWRSTLSMRDSSSVILRRIDLSNVTSCPGNVTRNVASKSAGELFCLLARFPLDALPTCLPPRIPGRSPVRPEIGTEYLHMILASLHSARITSRPHRVPRWLVAATHQAGVMQCSQCSRTDMCSPNSAPGTSLSAAAPRLSPACSLIRETGVLGHHPIRPSMNCERCARSSTGVSRTCLHCSLDSPGDRELSPLTGNFDALYLLTRQADFRSCHRSRGGGRFGS
jgi:hypothetical protein